MKFTDQLKTVRSVNFMFLWWKAANKVVFVLYVLAAGTNEFMGDIWVFYVF
ncbi:unknown [Odoribacter laneus CAG:561]|nr:unknown [Odoribacter laneus CAG:561]